MYYYKLNISDWGNSTSHLSLAEEAVYLRLINYYHDKEKPIPLETTAVCRRLRMSDNVEIAQSILDEFFEKTDKGWVHSRCEKDLKEYRKTAKKNKANGAKGGRPRKKAASMETQNKPNGLPDESQNNPNQEPLTTNHKPDNTRAKAKRFTPPLLNEVSDYFIERGGINEAQQFIDFYSSKGWMVGKNKMKDWKAATRNWIQRQTNGHNQKPNHKSNAVSRAHEAAANRERERQQRELAAGAGNGTAVGQANGDLRQSPGEQLWPDNAEGVGACIEGDYTRTN